MFLNSHSYFSLRYGTLSIDRLVGLAKEYNVKAMALTDINNSTGMIDFVKACRKQDIKPIGGMEFRNGNEYLYTGIARNNEGMRELNEYVSYHNLNKLDYPVKPKLFENAVIIYPFQKKGFVNLSDNEFIGVKPTDVLKLFTSDFSNVLSKVIIQQPVSFADKKGYQLHRNLRAVDNNILLSQLTKEMLADEMEYFMTTDQLLKYFKTYPQLVVNTE